MSFSLFDTADLERGLDLCSLRTNVISSNIANAKTPGYQARAVVFEEQMQRLNGDTGPSASAPKIVKHPVVESTGARVDIISEMASLSKNQILYSAYSGEITRVFSNLEWILDNTK